MFGLICLGKISLSHDLNQLRAWRFYEFTTSGNELLLSENTLMASLGDFGMPLSCLAQWVSLEVNLMTTTLLMLPADSGLTGIEEALVGTMVEKQSFIADFGLDEMGENQRANTIGNLVAMSQLGCIAGALS
jgi:hypothetical protein